MFVCAHCFVCLSGYLGGSFCVIVFSFITWRTSLLIGRELNGDPRPSHYFDDSPFKTPLPPGSAPAARMLAPISSFPDIARAAFGNVGCFLLSVILVRRDQCQLDYRLDAHKPRHSTVVAPLSRYRSILNFSVASVSFWWRSGLTYLSCSQPCRRCITRFWPRRLVLFLLSFCGHRQCSPT